MWCATRVISVLSIFCTSRRSRQHAVHFLLHTIPKTSPYSPHMPHPVIAYLQAPQFEVKRDEMVACTSLAHILDTLMTFRSHSSPLHCKWTHHSTATLTTTSSSDHKIRSLQSVCILCILSCHRMGSLYTFPFRQRVLAAAVAICTSTVKFKPSYGLHISCACCPNIENPSPALDYWLHTAHQGCLALGACIHPTLLTHRPYQRMPNS